MRTGDYRVFFIENRPVLKFVMQRGVAVNIDARTQITSANA